MISADKNDKTPLCPCHGAAMLARQDRPGWWRCKVKQREYDRRYHHGRYRQLVTEGMCGNCGQQEAVIGVRCFDCAMHQLDRNDRQLR